MSKEGGQGGEWPLEPFELPAELAAFLRGEEIAMVTQASDQGTVYVVKAPAREIESIAGRVPVQLSHDLYEHQSAPVIRTVVKIYDQPDRPLALETLRVCWKRTPAQPSIAKPCWVMPKAQAI